MAEYAAGVLKSVDARAARPSPAPSDDFDGAPPRPTVDVREPTTWATSVGVSGCKACGKPMALHGDALHPDGLCPWCRTTHLPHVMRKYLAEESTTPAPAPSDAVEMAREVIELDAKARSSEPMVTPHGYDIASARAAAAYERLRQLAPALAKSVIALSEERERLRIAGQRMSNLCFNLRQPSAAFEERHRAEMEALYKAWDAAARKESP